MVISVKYCRRIFYTVRYGTVYSVFCSVTVEKLGFFSTLCRLRLKVPPLQRETHMKMCLQWSHRTRYIKQKFQRPPHPSISIYVSKVNLYNKR
jgi:hypothetical protein